MTDAALARLGYPAILATHDYEVAAVREGLAALTKPETSPATGDPTNASG